MYNDLITYIGQFCDFETKAKLKRCCKLYNQLIHIETLNHDTVLTQAFITSPNAKKLFYHYYHQYYIQPKVNKEKKYYVASNDSDWDICVIIVATSKAEATYLHTIKDDPHRNFEMMRERVVEHWDGTEKITELVKEIIYNDFGDNDTYPPLVRIKPNSPRIKYNAQGEIYYDGDFYNDYMNEDNYYSRKN